MRFSKKTQPIPPDLPEGTVLIKDEKGQKVVVNSVNKFFINEPGEVVFGPYQYPFSIRVLDTKFNRRSYVESQRVSQAQYRVYLPKWKRCFTFTSEEVSSNQGRAKPKAKKKPPRS